MNKQKGFTIIELIVVIAIIAVLASIVLVNVTSYINKSKDSAIKANLDTIRTNAAIWMSDIDKGNGTYNNFLADTTYTTPLAAVKSQLPASSQANVTATCNDTDHLCDDAAATEFCISSPMATDATVIYCIDSTGKTSTGTCSNGGC